MKIEDLEKICKEIGVVYSPKGTTKNKKDKSWREMEIHNKQLKDYDICITWTSGGITGVIVGEGKQIKQFLENQNQILQI